MLTARAGNLKAAAASAAVTFALFVLIHKLRGKPVDWADAQLWALGAAASMFFIGV